MVGLKSDAAPRLPIQRAPKVCINVEVAVSPTSTVSFNEVRSRVAHHLENSGTVKLHEGRIALERGKDVWLDQHVEAVYLADLDEDLRISRGRTMFTWELEIQISVFQLSEEPPGEDDCGEEEISSFKEWQLPARDFHQLWEHLVYDVEIKHRLLQYAESALIFDRHHVDRTLISWSSMVLLHGPPGTGKTSLVKALAQKLAIRLSDRYESAQLIDINAHSLFSKYFSESGKLVSKLFAKINDMLEGGDCLLFLLIDEVESLASSRQSAAGGEPADSVRAVNALLTGLDALKNHSNVMVLTTSNLTDAVDSAFMDRADIKAYIGLPSVQARYTILLSCLAELQRVGLIEDGLLPQAFADIQGMSPTKCEETRVLSQALLSVSQQCDGFSGRMLRKLPLLAFRAVCVRQHAKLTCRAFIELLENAVQAELADRISCQLRI